MIYILSACIVIIIVTFYIMYTLGKKSGRDEWIINDNKIEDKEAKHDRQRYQKNMQLNVDDAVDRLRSRSNSST